MPKKLTLKEAQKLAKKRGGKCLSKKYINSNTKMKWKCKHGHTWEATLNKIKSKVHWCPSCAGKLKLTLKNAQQVAKERGGKCLSKKYINSNTKMKWQCKEGHTWETTFNKIKNEKTWCPSCAGKLKLTLKEMQAIAKERGGKCLSKEYINCEIKLKWKCKEGHVWEARAMSVKKGSWCPHCVKNFKLTLKDCQDVAKLKGGKCLSKKYINSNTKMKWQCKEGHIWEATSASVRSKTWCPTCGGYTRKTIEDAQKIAEERGGKCLSKKYIFNTKLKWECKEGHIWSALFGKIKDGRWCPYCKSNNGERACREIFEKLLNKLFPSARPKWNKNKDGNLMELDGFNPELGVAFEHQGSQHYKDVKFFHKGPNNLKKRQKDDKEKIRLSKKNGVDLIQIPSIFEMLGGVKPAIKFIKKALKEKGIKIVNDIVESDISTFYKSTYNDEKIEEMKTIAKERGGKCLSKKYINAKTKLKFKCKEGHIWEVITSGIYRGTWCPYCVNRVTKTIEEMRKVAKERGGRCLSEKYVNCQTKMKWECKEGHTWNASFENIKNGRWCPHCRRLMRLKEIKTIAKEKGGKCLSKKYINAQAKLKFQCNKGHTWDATSSSIKQGSWCPVCAKAIGGTRKKIIVDGVFYNSRKDAYKAHNVSSHTILKRAEKYKISIADAITMKAEGLSGGKICIINGKKFRSIKEASEYHGINPISIYRTIRRKGYSVEEAISHHLTAK
jgi:hypothetical protein